MTRFLGPSRYDGGVPPSDMLTSPGHLDSPTDPETFGYCEPEPTYKTYDVKGHPTMGETLETIGNEIGVTRERVRQIEVIALHKFRKHWASIIGEEITEAEAVSMIAHVAVEDAARKAGMA